MKNNNRIMEISCMKWRYIAQICYFWLQSQQNYIMIAESNFLHFKMKKERIQMSLYENWMNKAFSKEGRSVDAIWDSYLPKEQKIYEYILGQKVTKVEGTVQELADRFSMTAEEIVAFIDGINDVLPTPLEMSELTEESAVVLDIDFERLFKKMVEYHADHLVALPQWDGIFDENTRRKFTREQKLSRTIIKGEKIGRNDPCPCGSGKKYKKCCGANL